LPSSRLHFVLFAPLLLVFTAGGCVCKRGKWMPPEIVRPAASCSLDSFMAQAEVALAHAIELEKQENPGCVDAYFQSAACSWQEIQRQLHESGSAYGRPAEIYRSSLAQLIITGQNYGRLDPKSGLMVWTRTGQITIPTRFYGFAWQPDDFDYLIPVGEYSTRELNYRYVACGQGITAVVVRCRKPNEQFFNDQQLFAATVLLRGNNNDAGSGPTGMELEFYDPLRIGSRQIGGQRVDLQRDLTAPFAYRLSKRDRNYLTAFLQPGSTSVGDGLFMLEPYQPGKIPVVFIHGLLSDPQTWVNMANELSAQGDLMARYQIWGYEYATGEPFLASAARLRRQLQEIQHHLDPAGADRALSQVVLVGHSMGGLVAKLQVTSSGNELWSAVSCQPLENIMTTPETRASLVESFFFEPVPQVSRVVFIGTPHAGSPWANRPVGRLGSKLVQEPEIMRARREQLINDNPGVFSPEFSRRVPTSIDLLKPDSLLLRATDSLPISRRVSFHTIYGSGYWMLGGGNSDRVVPVNSSILPGAISDKPVHAKHTKLNRNPTSIDELFCILRTHLEQGETDVLQVDGQSLFINPLGR
jgi:pimeloyl-ACP methyl ester carboxylesterase